MTAEAVSGYNGVHAVARPGPCPRRRLPGRTVSRPRSVGVRAVVWAALVAVPVALAGPRFGFPPAVVFAAAAVALAGLTSMTGDAIEAVALAHGRRAGGLANAAFGSATLLALSACAVYDGRLTLVKASLTGSILTYLVLGLGLSAFLGGLRHGTQYFSREGANIAATMMVLSVIALGVPALYGQWMPVRNSGPVESLSEAVAAVMLGVFLLSRYYHLFWDADAASARRGARRTTVAADTRERGAHGAGSIALRARPVAKLAAVLAAVAVVAVAMVRVAPAAMATAGLNERFVGFIVVPLVSGAAVLHVGIRTAWRNRMDLSLAIITDASMAVVLWVAPLLVFWSLAVGHPMDLIFGPVELAAMAASAAIAALVQLDGESNWLEGAMLMAVYLLIGLAFSWWPAD